MSGWWEQVGRTCWLVACLFGCTRAFDSFSVSCSTNCGTNMDVVKQMKLVASCMGPCEMVSWEVRLDSDGSLLAKLDPGPSSYRLYLTYDSFLFTPHIYSTHSITATGTDPNSLTGGTDDYSFTLWSFPEMDCPGSFFPASGEALIQEYFSVCNDVAPPERSTALTAKYRYDRIIILPGENMTVKFVSPLPTMTIGAMPILPGTLEMVVTNSWSQSSYMPLSSTPTAWPGDVDARLAEYENMAQTMDLNTASTLIYYWDVLYFINYRNPVPFNTSSTGTSRLQVKERIIAWVKNQTGISETPYKERFRRAKLVSALALEVAERLEEASLALVQDVVHVLHEDVCQPRYYDLADPDSQPSQARTDTHRAILDVLLRALSFCASASAADCHTIEYESQSARLQSAALIADFLAPGASLHVDNYLASTRLGKGTGSASSLLVLTGHDVNVTFPGAYDSGWSDDLVFQSVLWEPGVLSPHLPRAPLTPGLQLKVTGALDMHFFNKVGAVYSHSNAPVFSSPHKLQTSRLVTSLPYNTRLVLVGDVGEEIVCLEFQTVPAGAGIRLVIVGTPLTLDVLAGGSTLYTTLDPDAGVHCTSNGCHPPQCTVLSEADASGAVCLMKRVGDANSTEVSVAAELLQCLTREMTGPDLAEYPQWQEGNCTVKSSVAGEVTCECPEFFSSSAVEQQQWSVAVMPPYSAQRRCYTNCFIGLLFSIADFHMNCQCSDCGSTSYQIDWEVRDVNTNAVLYTYPDETNIKLYAPQLHTHLGKTIRITCTLRFTQSVLDKSSSITRKIVDEFAAHEAEILSLVPTSWVEWGDSRFRHMANFLTIASALPPSTDYSPGGKVSSRRRIREECVSVLTLPVTEDEHQSCTDVIDRLFSTYNEVTSVMVTKGIELVNHAYDFIYATYAFHDPVYKSIGYGMAGGASTMMAACAATGTNTPLTDTERVECIDVAIHNIHRLLGFPTNDPRNVNMYYSVANLTSEDSAFMSNWFSDARYMDQIYRTSYVADGIGAITTYAQIIPPTTPRIEFQGHYSVAFQVFHYPSNPYRFLGMAAGTGIAAMDVKAYHESAESVTISGQITAIPTNVPFQGPEHESMVPFTNRINCMKFVVADREQWFYRIFMEGANPGGTLRTRTQLTPTATEHAFAAPTATVRGDFGEYTTLGALGSQDTYFACLQQSAPAVSYNMYVDRFRCVEFDTVGRQWVDSSCALVDTEGIMACQCNGTFPAPMLAIERDQPSLAAIIPTFTLVCESHCTAMVASDQAVKLRAACSECVSPLYQWTLHEYKAGGGSQQTDMGTSNPSSVPAGLSGDKKYGKYRVVLIITDEYDNTPLTYEYRGFVSTYSSAHARCGIPVPSALDTYGDMTCSYSVQVDGALVAAYTYDITNPEIGTTFQTLMSRLEPETADPSENKLTIDLSWKNPADVVIWTKIFKFKVVLEEVSADEEENSRAVSVLSASTPLSGLVMAVALANSLNDPASQLISSMTSAESKELKRDLLQYASTVSPADNDVIFLQTIALSVLSDQTDSFILLESLGYAMDVMETVNTITYPSPVTAEQSTEAARLSVGVLSNLLVLLKTIAPPDITLIERGINLLTSVAQQYSVGAFGLPFSRSQKNFTAADFVITIGYESSTTVQNMWLHRSDASRSAMRWPGSIPGGDTSQNAVVEFTTFFYNPLPSNVFIQHISHVSMRQGGNEVVLTNSANPIAVGYDVDFTTVSRSTLNVSMAAWKCSEFSVPYANSSLIVLLFDGDSGQNYKFRLAYQQFPTDASHLVEKDMNMRTDQIADSFIDESVVSQSGGYAICFTSDSPVITPVGVGMLPAQCMSWSDTTDSWTSTGCTLSESGRTDRHMECACSTLPIMTGVYMSPFGLDLGLVRELSLHCVENCKGLVVPDLPIKFLARCAGWTCVHAWKLLNRDSGAVIESGYPSQSEVTIPANYLVGTGTRRFTMEFTGSLAQYSDMTRSFHFTTSEFDSSVPTCELPPSIRMATEQTSRECSFAFVQGSDITIEHVINRRDDLLSTGAGLITRLEPATPGDNTENQVELRIAVVSRDGSQTTTLWRHYILAKATYSELDVSKDTLLQELDTIRDSAVAPSMGLVISLAALLVLEDSYYHAGTTNVERLNARENMLSDLLTRTIATSTDAFLLSADVVFLSSVPESSLAEMSETSVDTVMDIEDSVLNYVEVHTVPNHERLLISSALQKSVSNILRKMASALDIVRHERVSVLLSTISSQTAPALNATVRSVAYVYGSMVALTAVVDPGSSIYEYSVEGGDMKARTRFRPDMAGLTSSQNAVVELTGFRWNPFPINALKAVSQLSISQSNNIIADASIATPVVLHYQVNTSAAIATKIYGISLSSRFSSCVIYHHNFSGYAAVVTVVGTAGSSYRLTVGEGRRPNATEQLILDKHAHLWSDGRHHVVLEASTLSLGIEYYLCISSDQDSLEIVDVLVNRVMCFKWDTAIDTWRDNICQVSSNSTGAVQCDCSSIPVVSGFDYIEVNIMRYVPLVEMMCTQSCTMLVFPDLIYALEASCHGCHSEAGGMFSWRLLNNETGAFIENLSSTEQPAGATVSTVTFQPWYLSTINFPNVRKFTTEVTVSTTNVPSSIVQVFHFTVSDFASTYPPCSLLPTTALASLSLSTVMECLYLATHDWDVHFRYEVQLVNQPIPGAVVINRFDAVTGPNEDKMTLLASVVEKQNEYSNQAPIVLWQRQFEFKVLLGPMDTTKSYTHAEIDKIKSSTELAALAISTSIACNMNVGLKTFAENFTLPERKDYRDIILGHLLAKTPTTGEQNVMRTISASSLTLTYAQNNEATMEKGMTIVDESLAYMRTNMVSMEDILFTTRFCIRVLMNVIESVSLEYHSSSQILSDSTESAVQRLGAVADGHARILNSSSPTSSYAPGGATGLLGHKVWKSSSLLGSEAIHNVGNNNVKLFLPSAIPGVDGTADLVFQWTKFNRDPFPQDDSVKQLNVFHMYQQHSPVSLSGLTDPIVLKYEMDSSGAVSETIDDVSNVAHSCVGYDLTLPERSIFLSLSGSPTHNYHVEVGYQREPDEFYILANISADLGSSGGHYAVVDRSLLGAAGLYYICLLSDHSAASNVILKAMFVDCMQWDSNNDVWGADGCKVSTANTEPVTCHCTDFDSRSILGFYHSPTGASTDIPTLEIQCLDNCEAFVKVENAIRVRGVCSPVTCTYNWVIVVRGSGAIVGGSEFSGQEIIVPANFLASRTETAFDMELSASTDVLSSPILAVFPIMLSLYPSSVSSCDMMASLGLSTSSSMTCTYNHYDKLDIKMEYTVNRKESSRADPVIVRLETADPNDATENQLELKFALDTDGGLQLWHHDILAKAVYGNLDMSANRALEEVNKIKASTEVSAALAFIISVAVNLNNPTSTAASETTKAERMSIREDLLNHIHKDRPINSPAEAVMISAALVELAEIPAELSEHSVDYLLWIVKDDLDYIDLNAVSDEERLHITRAIIVTISSVLRVVLDDGAATITNLTSSLEAHSLLASVSSHAAVSLNTTAPFVTIYTTALAQQTLRFPSGSQSHEHAVNGRGIKGRMRIKPNMPGLNPAQDVAVEFTTYRWNLFPAAPVGRVYQLSVAQNKVPFTHASLTDPVAFFHTVNTSASPITTLYGVSSNVSPCVFYNHSTLGPALLLGIVGPDQTYTILVGENESPEEPANYLVKRTAVLGVSGTHEMILEASLLSTAVYFFCFSIDSSAPVTIDLRLSLVRCMNFDTTTSVWESTRCKVSSNTTLPVQCECPMVPVVSSVVVDAATTHYIMPDVSIACINNCNAFAFLDQPLELEARCPACSPVVSYNWEVLNSETSSVIDNSFPAQEQFLVPAYYFQDRGTKQFSAKLNVSSPGAPGVIVLHKIAISDYLSNVSPCDILPTIGLASSDGNKMDCTYDYYKGMTMDYNYTVSASEVRQGYVISGFQAENVTDVEEDKLTILFTLNNAGRQNVWQVDFTFKILFGTVDTSKTDLIAEVNKIKTSTVQSASLAIAIGIAANLNGTHARIASLTDRINIRQDTVNYLSTLTPSEAKDNVLLSLSVAMMTMNSSEVSVSTAGEALTVVETVMSFLSGNTVTNTERYHSDRASILTVSNVVSALLIDYEKSSTLDTTTMEEAVGSLGPLAREMADTLNSSYPADVMDTDSFVLTIRAGSLYGQEIQLVVPDHEVELRMPGSIATAVSGQDLVVQWSKFKQNPFPSNNTVEQFTSLDVYQNGAQVGLSGLSDPFRLRYVMNYTSATPVTLEGVSNAVHVCALMSLPPSSPNLVITVAGDSTQVFHVEIGYRREPDDSYVLVNVTADFRSGEDMHYAAVDKSLLSSSGLYYICVRSGSQTAQNVVMRALAVDCMQWNTATDMWGADGCQLSSADSSEPVTCLCSSITSVLGFQYSPRLPSTDVPKLEIQCLENCKGLVMPDLDLKIQAQCTVVICTYAWTLRVVGLSSSNLQLGDTMSGSEVSLAGGSLMAKGSLQFTLDVVATSADLAQPMTFTYSFSISEFPSTASPCSITPTVGLTLDTSMRCGYGYHSNMEIGILYDVDIKEVRQGAWTIKNFETENPSVMDENELIIAVRISDSSSNILWQYGTTVKLILGEIDNAKLAILSEVDKIQNFDEKIPTLSVLLGFASNLNNKTAAMIQAVTEQERQNIRQTLLSHLMTMPVSSPDQVVMTAAGVYLLTTDTEISDRSVDKAMDLVDRMLTYLGTDAVTNIERLHATSALLYTVAQFLHINLNEYAISGALNVTQNNRFVATLSPLVMEISGYLNTSYPSSTFVTDSFELLVESGPGSGVMGTEIGGTSREVIIKLPTATTSTTTIVERCDFAGNPFPIADRYVEGVVKVAVYQNGQSLLDSSQISLSSPISVDYAPSIEHGIESVLETVSKVASSCLIYDVASPGRGLLVALKGDTNAVYHVKVGVGGRPGTDDSVPEVTSIFGSDNTHYAVVDASVLSTTAKNFVCVTSDSVTVEAVNATAVSVMCMGWDAAAQDWKPACQTTFSDRANYPVRCSCTSLSSLLAVETFVTTMEVLRPSLSVECVENCVSYVRAEQKVKLRAVCEDCQFQAYSWKVLYRQTGHVVRNFGDGTGDLEIPELLLHNKPSAAEPTLAFTAEVTVSSPDKSVSVSAVYYLMTAYFPDNINECSLPASAGMSKNSRMECFYKYKDHRLHFQYDLDINTPYSGGASSLIARLDPIVNTTEPDINKLSANVALYSQLNATVWQTQISAKATLDKIDHLRPPVLGELDKLGNSTSPGGVTAFAITLMNVFNDNITSDIRALKPHERRMVRDAVILTLPLNITVEDDIFMLAMSLFMAADSDQLGLRAVDHALKAVNEITEFMSLSINTTAEIRDRLLDAQLSVIANLLLSSSAKFNASQDGIAHGSRAVDALDDFTVELGHGLVPGEANIRQTSLFTVTAANNHSFSVLGQNLTFEPTFVNPAAIAVPAVLPGASGNLLVKLAKFEKNPIQTLDRDLRWVSMLSLHGPPADLHYSDLEEPFVLDYQLNVTWGSGLAVQGIAKERYMCLTMNMTLPHRDLLLVLEGERKVTYEVLMRYKRIPKRNSSLPGGFFRMSESTKQHIHIEGDDMEKSGIYYICLTSNEERNTSVILSATMLACVSWNGTDWTKKGCVLASSTNDYQIRCNCNHLSLFGLEMASMPMLLSKSMTIPLIPPSWLVVLCMMTVCSIYGLLTLYTRYRDKHDGQQSVIYDLHDNSPLATFPYLVTLYTGVRKEAGTTASVAMKLHGTLGESEAHIVTEVDSQILLTGGTDTVIIRCKEPIGELERITVWHDDKGASPDWYASHIVVQNLLNDAQIWVFLCYTWMTSFNSTSGCTKTFYRASQQDLSRFRHVYSSRLRNGFRDEHLWFSVLAKPPGSSFTRTQRLSCCFGLFVSTLFSNILFVESSMELKAENATILDYRLMYISLMSSLIVVIPNIIIVSFFRYARRRKVQQIPIISHDITILDQFTNQFDVVERSRRWQKKERTYSWDMSLYAKYLNRVAVTEYVDAYTVHRMLSPLSYAMEPYFAWTREKKAQQDQIRAWIDKMLNWDQGMRMLGMVHPWEEPEKEKVDLYDEWYNTYGIKIRKEKLKNLHSGRLFNIGKPRKDYEVEEEDIGLDLFNVGPEREEEDERFPDFSSVAPRTESVLPPRLPPTLYSMDMAVCGPETCKIVQPEPRESQQCVKFPKYVFKFDNVPVKKELYHEEKEIDKGLEKLEKRLEKKLDEVRDVAGLSGVSGRVKKGPTFRMGMDIDAGVQDAIRASKEYQAETDKHFEMIYKRLDDHCLEKERYDREMDNASPSDDGDFIEESWTKKERKKYQEETDRRLDQVSKLLDEQRGRIESLQKDDASDEHDELEGEDDSVKEREKEKSRRLKMVSELVDHQKMAIEKMQKEITLAKAGDRMLLRKREQEKSRKETDKRLDKVSKLLEEQKMLIDRFEDEEVGSAEEDGSAESGEGEITGRRKESDKRIEMSAEDYGTRPWKKGEKKAYQLETDRRLEALSKLLDEQQKDLERMDAASKHVSRISLPSGDEEEQRELELRSKRLEQEKMRRLNEDLPQMAATLLRNRQSLGLPLEDGIEVKVMSDPPEVLARKRKLAAQRYQQVLDDAEAEARERGLRMIRKLRDDRKTHGIPEDDRWTEEKFLSRWYQNPFTELHEQCTKQLLTIDFSPRRKEDSNAQNLSRNNSTDIDIEDTRLLTKKQTAVTNSNTNNETVVDVETLNRSNEMSAPMLPQIEEETDQPDVCRIIWDKGEKGKYHIAKSRRNNSKPGRFSLVALKRAFKRKSNAGNYDSDYDEDSLYSVTSAVEERQPNLRLPYWFRHVAWGLHTAVSVVCVIMTLYYGFEYGESLSAKWLVSIVQSLTINILVIQPIKVVILTGVLSILFGSWEDQNMIQVNSVPWKPEKLDPYFMTSRDEYLSWKRKKDPRYRPLARTHKTMEKLRAKMTKGIIKTIRIVCRVGLMVLLVWLHSQPGAFNLSHRVSSDLTAHLTPVLNRSEVWPYLTNTWLPAMYDPATEDHFIETSQSFLVGPTRLRQFRHTPVECGALATLRGEGCDRDRDEIRTSYGAGWDSPQTTPDTDTETETEYSNQETAWFYDYTDVDGYLTTDFHDQSSRGYSALLTNDSTQAKLILQHLIDNDWIDEKTTSLLAESALYNVNMDVYLFTVIEFEYSESGAVFTSSRFELLKSYYRAHSDWTTLLELVFIYLVVDDVARFVIKMRNSPKGDWSVTERVGFASFVLVEAATVGVHLVFSVTSAYLPENVKMNSPSFESLHLALMLQLFTQTFLGLLAFVAMVRAVLFVGIAFRWRVLFNLMKLYILDILNVCLYVSVAVFGYAMFNHLYELGEAHVYSSVGSMYTMSLHRDAHKLDNQDDLDFGIFMTISKVFMTRFLLMNCLAAMIIVSWKAESRKDRESEFRSEVFDFILRYFSRYIPSRKLAERVRRMDAENILSESSVSQKSGKEMNESVGLVWESSGTTVATPSNMKTGSNVNTVVTDRGDFT